MLAGCFELLVLKQVGCDGVNGGLEKSGKNQLRSSVAKGWEGERITEETVVDDESD